MIVNNILGKKIANKLRGKIEFYDMQSSSRWCELGAMLSGNRRKQWKISNSRLRQLVGAELEEFCEINVGYKISDLSAIIKFLEMYLSQKSL